MWNIITSLQWLWSIILANVTHFAEPTTNPIFWSILFRLFFPLKTHYLAGNYLLFSKQPWVKSCPEVSAGVETIKIGYLEGERFIKINFGFIYRLPTAYPTWATQIQLLANPKSLQCKSFLQWRVLGAAFVYCWNPGPSDSHS